MTSGKRSFQTWHCRAASCLRATKIRRNGRLFAVFLLLLRPGSFIWHEASLDCSLFCIENENTFYKFCQRQQRELLLFRHGRLRLLGGCGHRRPHDKEASEGFRHTVGKHLRHLRDARPCRPHQGARPVGGEVPYPCLHDRADTRRHQPQLLCDGETLHLRAPSGERRTFPVEGFPHHSFRGAARRHRQCGLLHRGGWENFFLPHRPWAHHACCRAVYLQGRLFGD